MLVHYLHQRAPKARDLEPLTAIQGADGLGQAVTSQDAQAAEHESGRHRKLCLNLLWEPGIRGSGPCVWLWCCQDIQDHYMRRFNVSQRVMRS